MSDSRKDSGSGSEGGPETGWKFGVVGRIGAVGVRAIHALCRVTKEGEEHWMSAEEGGGTRWLACIWHGTMLSPIWDHRDRGAVALVSEHRDGEYLTHVLTRLGYGHARGSSTRGGARGFRGLLRAARDGHIVAVTPDGPKGPHQVVKSGVVALAARSRLPVIPIGVGMSRAWRLDSWDRFSIPKPFSRVHLRYGEPIVVPRELDEAATEAFTARLQAVMDELTASARATAGERP